MADQQLEVSHSFHSLSLHPDNIDTYYAYDIVTKFQQLGIFFDECIDCINGPYGLLKKSIKIKLGDKIAGNDEKVDLQAMLVLLKEIHTYSYQGIRYVSRLAALKEKIEKIKHEKVWDTQLEKFDFKYMKLSEIFKNSVMKYGCMYACGSATGGCLGLLSVGAGLGLIFGLAFASVSNILAIFGGIIGITALGISAGLFGFWFYEAVKLGKHRSTTFEKFRELEVKMDETRFKPNLKNFVLTLKNYCEGVMEIVNVSFKPRALSVRDTTSISHQDQPNEDDLILEYKNCYERKIEEFKQHREDMNEETRRDVALNVVMDRCKDKLRDIGYSGERINAFLTNKLMPEIRDV